MPFDVGILPTTLTLFNEPLLALVLDEFSHPVNIETESRLLAAIERQDGIPMLLAAPTADERAIQCLDELTVDHPLSRRGCISHLF